MSFELEIRFLTDIYKKIHLHTHCLEAGDEREVDLGLRRLLGFRSGGGLGQIFHLEGLQPHTLYRVTDPFFCTYLLLRLPESEKLLLIGPYLSAETGHKQLLEQAERWGVPPQKFGIIEKYFESVPMIPYASAVLAPLEAFCDRIWGGDNYSAEDVSASAFRSMPEIMPAEPDRKAERGELTEYIRRMEERYAFETELMQAVALGHSHKMELLMSAFSHTAFERRMTDPVRNLKNYAIIMNTLMRKAAQQGGVHPVYLDRLSTAYALKIEEIRSMEEGRQLMTDIFQGYCRLVKRHSTGRYSPPVQKVILQIDADISADLGLKTLAEAQNINASYLSALFKKETGQTLTDYVSGKRVEHALRLLTETRLQVQTIAQYCGIPDVNYFTKIFKKYVGKTPKQFRQENRHPLGTAGTA